VADRRHLLGILVYNGRSVVRRCLDSAAALVSDRVDVMVFDDCSPIGSPIGCHSRDQDRSWSDEVAAMCADRALGYYRSPRNLGIPRNMSLVMLTALAGGYDCVGLINSDVVLPANLVDVVGRVLDADPSIASVTPWSNNVSLFSMSLGCSHTTMAAQPFVSALSAALWSTNGAAAIDLPTGVGFCMMIPTNAIREIGVMDPIFGRGYCEEVDWCQRARLGGRRNVLATGAFVYHEGAVTTTEAGLIQPGDTTIREHEMIITDRYPDYRQAVDMFFASGDFAAMEQRSRAAASSAGVPVGLGAQA